MTDTKNIIPVWEAIKLFLEGNAVIDKDGHTWKLLSMTSIFNSPRLGEFVNAAPFRLAEPEKPSTKENVPDKDYKGLLYFGLKDFLKSSARHEELYALCDDIINLIHSEATKIAQSEYRISNENIYAHLQYQTIPELKKELRTIACEEVNKHLDAFHTKSCDDFFHTRARNIAREEILRHEEVKEYKNGSTKETGFGDAESPEEKIK